MLDLKKMLEAGVHFGHKTSRWHPKMQRYIWGSKNYVHLIDVSKTALLLNRAGAFLKETVANGGQCILIGTKKPAQSIILRVASHTGMPFVINRWVGGTLSNNDQVRKAVTRLLYLRDVLDRPTGHYKKKELSMIQKEVGRLEKNVGGIIDFRFPPAALIIVDAQKEISAIKEANRLGIPVIAIVDTNTNPEGVSFIIPANDDSPKSITFLMDYLEQNMLEGLEIWKSKLTEEEKQRITQEQEERVARHKEHEASMKAKQEAREQRQAAADAEPTSEHRPFGRGNHGGERKPFQKRFGGQRFEHRSENQDDEGGSEDRPSRPEGDRPYTPRGDRPYTPRGDRPYTPRGDRPYTPRPEGDRPYTPRGDRPYTPRPDGDRPYTPRGDRPYTPRPDGDRPYTPRGDRPYTPRGDRPYTPRPDGDRPYTPRTPGDRPYTPRGDRPYTPRPDGDRPYTPRGDRPYTPRGDRPYTPRPDGDRPYTPRGDRPFTPRGDRPYTPRPDGDRPYTPRGDRPFTPRGDRPYTPRPTEQTPKQAPEQTPKDTDNKSE